MPDVRIYPDPQQTAEACAAQILEWLREAIALRGVASLAISGGTSPRAMFRCFALASLPWEKVHLFWVDERCVPPDDPESNFKLANDTWLASAPVQPVIHRIVGELSPALAAERYTADIRSIFATASSEIGSDTEIRFDVVHRGMGADAHTASLFPGDPLVNDLTSLTGVARREVPRVTLMPAVLESARHHFGRRVRLIPVTRGGVADLAIVIEETAAQGCPLLSLVISSITVPILTAHGPAAALLRSWKVAQTLIEIWSGVASDARAIVEAGAKRFGDSEGDVAWLDINRDASARGLKTAAADSPQ